MRCTRSRLVLLAAAALGAGTSSSFGQALQNILSPNDFIIAVDGTRTNLPAAPVPDAEGPANVLDGNSGTKYLNFGRETTGFIVMPALGPSTVQSFRLTTANDFTNRDPAGYLLYGTNSPITSAANSAGNSEPWTLIQRGTMTLSDIRQEVQAPVNVTNGSTFASYKLVFNTLKSGTNPSSMQVADVQFFTQPAAGGNPILAVGDDIRAIDVTDSAYPPTERPLEAVDGLKTSASKYLNFGREGAGLIVTPAAGLTAVKALRLTTANDQPGRDPSSYQIFGTNDPISSYEHSDGNSETWTPISSGALTLPGDPAVNTDQRNIEGPIVEFANDTAYRSYKILFPDVKGGTTANSVQFSEIELFVPEPGTAGLFLGAGLLALARRRRKA
jgi:hypothetical protein